MFNCYLFSGNKALMLLLNTDCGTINVSLQITSDNPNCLTCVFIPIQAKAGLARLLDLRKVLLSPICCWALINCTLILLLYLPIRYAQWVN